MRWHFRDERGSASLAAGNFWRMAFGSRVYGALKALFVASVVALISASTAYADICSSLRGQMVVSGGGGAEAAALSRQYTALQALERKRGCAKGKRAGGFFDPCADVAARKAAVLRQLSQTRGGGNTAVIKARLDAAGCTMKRKPDSRKTVTEVRTSRPSGPSFGRSDMLFCVREADGYFFPVPTSQYVNGSEYKEVVDQCRFICKSPEMSVYRLDDPGLETDQMVSVEKGNSYSDLPTAFAYRDSAGFEPCDFQSYYRRVEEARSRTVTPYDMKNAVVPLPRQRPEDGPSMAMQAETEPAAEPELREMSFDTQRSVRVVGPNFFPN